MREADSACILSIRFFWINSQKDSIMEQLNRIAIRGHIGNVRIQEVRDTKVARFCIVTHYAYKSKQGLQVVETMWHNVTAWEGRNIKDVERLKSADSAYVVGRLKSNRFTGSDGHERTCYEIVAYDMECYYGEPLRYEM